jgi:dTDP-4-dehydrorhamnose reductase
MKVLIVGGNSNLGGVLKNVLADHFKVVAAQSLRHLKENIIYPISKRHAEEIGSLSFFIR